MDPRHPNQLYETGLEGLLMMAILAFFFWRTDARYKPGFLFGLAAIIYGLIRFAIEFVRATAVQLGTRTEVPRVGKGSVRTCRSRWSRRRYKRTQSNNEKITR